MMKGMFYFLAILFFFGCNVTSRQSDDDFMNLSLTWEFKGNDPLRGVSSAIFTLENSDKKALVNSNWKLYFNQMGTGILQESVTGHVKIEHINGDLFCISPLEDFLLNPGEEVEITYDKRGSIIKETEAPSGPYFVFSNSDSGSEKAVAVEKYSIMPYPGLEMIYPPETGIPLPDAEWVFGQNRHLTLLEISGTGWIIPTPVQTLFGEEKVILRGEVKIHHSAGLEQEAGYLAHMLESVLRVSPVIVLSEKGGENVIRLSLSDQVEADNPEAYQLSVVLGNGIDIVGEGSAGVFYGIQSLLAILPVEAWETPRDGVELDCVKIIDSPSFGYRGVMLDVSRNFHHPHTIMRLIDVMGFYKMNKLHLSLTNDEAWRIEIPSLPELTEVGGFRGFTTNSYDRLIPAYGSGPGSDPDKGMGSGFLSREQFIQILKYAQTRHVEVIPEINFPGHARAAIYAMENRYARLMKEGKIEEAEKYRLADPEDRSIYNSAQNFNDNVVCVCKEAPFLFFETVVDEITGMYKEAGLELKILHTGGDEVPAGSWAGSPICSSFLESNPGIGTAADLQVYFESRLLEILSRKNLVMAGWEEIALKKDDLGKWIPNPDFAGKGMLPYVWNSLGDFLDLGNRVANAGFPVVLCNVDNFYMDLAYNHHPAEPGHYWGGFVNTRRAYEFAPFNVFYTTLNDRYRRPFGPEKSFKEMEALKQESRENIVGLQGQLWSETVKGSEMLEYYYLPKMLGLAERAWTGQASWGEIDDRANRLEAMAVSWNEFANVIGQRDLPRLDYIFGGYNYRFPPPGGEIREGMLYANIDFPGLSIRYTTDGSEPGIDSPPYTGPFEVSGAVSLRSFDTRGRGSRVSLIGPGKGHSRP